MKILFTADLHSNKEAFQSFVSILDSQDFDIGVIAGDLTEGWLRFETLISMFDDVTAEDFVPELYGPDDSSDAAAAAWSVKIESLLQRGLVQEEQELKEILKSTKKPILIVRGNHDRTEWKGEQNIYNIHWKKVKFGAFNFVGYHYTEFTHTQEQQQKDFQTLRKHIDSKTVLLTHIPAFGVVKELIHETNPWLHLHGHIHRPDQLIGNQGTSVNGAYPYLNKFYGINVDTREITYETSDTVDLKGAA